jgi:hypothetical protein
MGKYTKEPMNMKNKERWLSFMQKAENYIRSLMDNHGHTLLAGRRRTGFLGFLSNMHAYRNMFEQLVESGQLRDQFLFLYSQFMKFYEPTLNLLPAT